MKRANKLLYVAKKLIAALGSCTALLSVSIATSQADGDLGSRSVGTSIIVMSIVQPARFFAPASVFEDPEINRSSRAITDFSVPNNASSPGAEPLLSSEFYRDDATTQYLLTRQLSTTGSTRFLLCVPQGRGDVNLLTSNQKAAVYTTSTDTGEHSMSVSLTKSNGDRSAISNSGCADGGKTEVRISMTKLAVVGARASSSDITKASKSVDRPAKIGLIIIPQ